MVWGYLLYVIGGWLFAFLYFLLFDSIGLHTWWFGALAGLVHGLFLLVCALPLLPFVHPRMASEYHGVTARRQLEPPGFMAMNYGYGTPLTTLRGADRVRRGAGRVRAAGDLGIEREASVAVERRRREPTTARAGERRAHQAAHQRHVMRRRP